MPKMKTNACGICGNAFPGYVMQNKLVCLRCDELTFDLEIECDQEMAAPTELPRGTQPLRSVTITIPKK